jgi:nucleotide-binding universal stress UspA family protein
MEVFKNILIPYDFREMAEVSLSQSYNLARLAGLDITLLHVYEEGNKFAKLFYDTKDKEDYFLKEIEQQLQEVASKAQKESGITIHTIMDKGRIHSKIVEISEMIQAKYIVMALSSLFESDPDKKMVGANVSRVIRTAKCPVMTVNNKTHHDGCRAILLPLDLTKQTRHKVGWAIDVASKFGAKIRVVSALWSRNHEEIVKQLRAQLIQVKRFIEDKGIEVTAEIIESEQGHKTVVPAILDYAHQQGDIDLIMIMTQQEVGWVEFFVGSHANEFIRLADVPVMSIVPKDTGERLAR